MRFFIGDVRDRERLVQAMSGVDFVIHAAALKQVPAAEYNPMECIKTNIHGAENVIAGRACQRRRQGHRALDRQGREPDQSLRRDQARLGQAVRRGEQPGGRPQNAGFRSFATATSSARGARSCRSFAEQIADGMRPPADHRCQRMTRFWITLQQGVDFVLKNFERMHGGEIFVPKIPSVRVIDLAAAHGARHCRQRVVGIRPGEKLHEVMCPATTRTSRSNSTITSSSSRPSSSAGDVDFSVNRLGEQGEPVRAGLRVPLRPESALPDDRGNRRTQSRARGRR